MTRDTETTVSEQRRSPTDTAAELAERIAELEAERADCRTRAERRPINRQLHLLRGLLQWYETRVRL